MQFVINIIRSIITGTWKEHLNNPGHSSVWLEAAIIVDIKSTDASIHIEWNAIRNENRPSKNWDDDIDVNEILR